MEVDEQLKKEKKGHGKSIELIQLQSQIEILTTKMDEAKVQLHLGAKDAQDKLQPHVDKLEQELEEAKQQWQQVEEASEKSLKDIEKGLRVSITAMKKSFENAKKHFTDEEKK